MTEREEILSALKEEQQFNNCPLCFRVEQSLQYGDIFKVVVDPESDRSILDESLEGLTANWTIPQPGHANILSVVPEDNLLNLRFVVDSPPREGGLVRVHLPDYLDKLIGLWQEEEISNACLKWLHDVQLQDVYSESKSLRNDYFIWLRSRQREAFRLCGCQRGFLWGPPGTGKTTTLGCMLAQYLVQFPYDHVLLLSTSNTAVDQALVAVDKGLEHLETHLAGAKAARHECKRIGLHFIASHYHGREHLLPDTDPDLIRRLAHLEATRPDPRDDKKYASWRDAIDSVRAEIREIARQDLINARLAAMTTTRATFDFEILQDLGYDLVTFDEASQVGLAHALILSRLGSRVLFAGDPKQLVPIVQSDSLEAECWLRRSMFEYMPLEHFSTCILDEQNRMAGPICRIVSRLFYGNQLKVAHEALANPDWHAERKLTNVPRIANRPVHIQNIEQEGIHANPGWYRLLSMEFICQAILDLVRADSPIPQEDILVVTPFRAQRHRIRERLRQLGLNRVAITTVHQAQGSERHTVFFDPVRGNSQFLMSEEGQRIINVAISRAKARLVITLSRGDRQNPTLDFIQMLVDGIE